MINIMIKDVTGVKVHMRTVPQHEWGRARVGVWWVVQETERCCIYEKPYLRAWKIVKEYWPVES